MAAIQAISGVLAQEIQAVPKQQDADSAQGLKKAHRGAGGTPPAGKGGPPPAVGAGKTSSSAKASSSSSSARVYDVRDTNQDGTVSYEEQIQYELKQAAQQASTQPGAVGYNQQGKATVHSTAVQGTVNLLA